MVIHFLDFCLEYFNKPLSKITIFSLKYKSLKGEFTKYVLKVIEMKKTRKPINQEQQEYLDFIEMQVENDSMSPEEAGFLIGTF